MRIIVLVLLLSGCATPGPDRIPTGRQVDPPEGYVDYCYRHPDYRECKDKK